MSLWGLPYKIKTKTKLWELASRSKKEKWSEVHFLRKMDNIWAIFLGKLSEAYHSVKLYEFSFKEEVKS